jgi:hypothetical protein
MDNFSSSPSPQTLTSSPLMDSASSFSSTCTITSSVGSPTPTRVNSLDPHGNGMTSSSSDDERESDLSKSSETQRRYYEVDFLFPSPSLTDFSFSVRFTSLVLLAPIGLPNIIYQKAISSLFKLIVVTISVSSIMFFIPMKSQFINQQMNQMKLFLLFQKMNFLSVPCFKIKSLHKTRP